MPQALGTVQVWYMEVTLSQNLGGWWFQRFFIFDMSNPRYLGLVGAIAPSVDPSATLSTKYCALYISIRSIIMCIQYVYVYIYVLHHSQRPCVRERHSPNMSFHQTWSWSVTMITNRATSSMGTKGAGSKLPIELIGEEACTNSNTAFPVILRASNFHDVFKELLGRESNAVPYLDIEGSDSAHSAQHAILRICGFPSDTSFPTISTAKVVCCGSHALRKISMFWWNYARFDREFPMVRYSSIAIFPLLLFIPVRDCQQVSRVQLNHSKMFVVKSPTVRCLPLYIFLHYVPSHVDDLPFS